MYGIIKYILTGDALRKKHPLLLYIYSVILRGELKIGDFQIERLITACMMIKS